MHDRHTHADRQTDSQSGTQAYAGTHEDEDEDERNRERSSVRATRRCAGPHTVLPAVRMAWHAACMTYY